MGNLKRALGYHKDIIKGTSRGTREDTLAARPRFSLGEEDHSPCHGPAVHGWLERAPPDDPWEPFGYVWNVSDWEMETG